MKKLLTITTSLILSSSTVIILADNINTYQTANKIRVNSHINWINVQKNNNNYFKNIKENYYKNPSLKFIFKENKEVNIEDVIGYAQNKANSYTEKFQKQNFNLNQILNTLSKNNPKFGKKYNQHLNQKDTIINTNLLSSTNSGLLKNTNFSSLENYVNNLKIARTTFISISAAATGFWAELLDDLELAYLGL
ncbi:hypothetical protein [Spiroplasma endosymbiont of Nebria brevicollis]|uniref:hypothetical protein n=1 Tax=Spiroplasma endosymbiont of Nebria brevicollis TaxID=3066284 RepID=UPI00313E196E